MFTKYKLLLTGIAFIIAGIILIYLQATNKKELSSSSEFAISYKGIIAIIASLLIGVITILDYFGIW